MSNAIQNVEEGKPELPGGLSAEPFKYATCHLYELMFLACHVFVADALFHGDVPCIL